MRINKHIISIKSCLSLKINSPSMMLMDKSRKQILSMRSKVNVLKVEEFIVNVFNKFAMLM